jgi:hypothetical protein
VHNVPELEVDSGGDEGWCDDQVAYLHLEVSFVELIISRHDVANISYQFVCAYKRDCNCVAPCSVPDAEDDVNEKTQTEEACKRSILSK